MSIISDVPNLLQAWIFVHIRSWVKPTSSLALGMVYDLTQSRSQLMLENAMLRKQLTILKREVKQPTLSQSDRRWLVILASRIQNWQQTLLIVQPETLLRWHRELFRRFWKSRSKAKIDKPRIPQETIDLIRKIASDNILWGAERIRGELLKLDIRVSKRTIQKYMMQAGKKRHSETSSQNWKTFIANHADHVWACDFVQTYDLLFRTIFVFFIIEIGSRRVVHFNVTRHPSDQWVSQQLREATPYDVSPRFLIRDNDKKFGQKFSMVARGANIEVLRTPMRAPKANAHCERFIGSFRRECLDHMIILNEQHLRRVTHEYVDSFNSARPHQGIGQSIPDPLCIQQASDTNKIEAYPILNGLHHDYRRLA